MVLFSIIFVYDYLDSITWTQGHGTKACDVGCLIEKAGQSQNSAVPLHFSIWPHDKRQGPQSVNECVADSPSKL